MVRVAPLREPIAAREDAPAVAALERAPQRQRHESHSTHVVRVLAVSGNERDACIAREPAHDRWRHRADPVDLATRAEEIGGHATGQRVSVDPHVE